ncbi:opioid growth factor receptor-like protein 1 isoform X2 [Hyla sarda]|uniref:opioid growth factor receptor-like protein 1 isoform X2 n=1 Tax=Hyla sarda TaxID=327740 RepID=UPI0024C2C46A|nr:opioid growth factor receptor-like protein 1 isoform X2 [Hyla sarda]
MTLPGRTRRRTEEGRKKPTYSRRWRNRAARDLQCYRHGYRGENASDQSCTEENSKTMPNLDFYQNKERFEPNGLCIDDLLSDWKEDYPTLERNHSYIQWLFPLREYGMNSYAKPLTLNEIAMMKKDKAVMARFLKAYRLMLHFYGIKLINEETGEVKKEANWEERFKNLNYHSHNNLRITRILKCLGEMGYDHFQAPLVKFFLEETLVQNRLPNVKRSVLDYFMFAVKNKYERRKLVHFAWENYKQNNHQERFIWGPVEKLKHFHPWEENEVNNSSEGPQDGVGKNLDSKPYKNYDKGKQSLSVHGGRVRDEKVMVSQCDSKMENVTASELIPMEDRGVLPENSPNHNTDTRPNQSTPLFKDVNSIMGQKEDNTEEKNDAKKEVEYENAKEDSSKVHKEEVIRKSKQDQEGGLEVNGPSSQNIDNKRIQGDHRKRKMPDSSTVNLTADDSTAADCTQSYHCASPCLSEEEGGQVDGVEDKVKKLKLKEKRNANDHPYGTEEDNPLDDASSGEKGENLSFPNIEFTFK